LNKKEEILKMYYEEHQKQQDIAQKFKVSQSYISQVIKEDERYNLNKETKHKESMIKKADYNKEYYKTYKRPKKDDNSYQELQAQLAKDTAELSYQSGYNMSDYDFAKCNPNAYHRNSKGNLVLVKGLKVGADVPKSINMNIKVPTQKYKQRCCFTR
jgi:transposase-like protein